MTSLKKIPFMVIILMGILVIFSACSGNSGTTQLNTTTIAPTIQNTTALTSSGNVTTQATTSGTTGKNPNETPATTIPGVTIESGTGDGKGASLPAGYPADLFPIYKDSYIIGVVVSGGSYTIMAESKDDWKTVAAFYKDVLKTAQVTSNTDTPTSFTSFGKIGSYTYNFDTADTEQPEQEGYKTSIMIMLMP